MTHFRDFLDPEIDRSVPAVLTPKDSLTHRVLQKGGASALRLMGGELIHSDSEAQHWEFNNTSNRAVIEILEPDIVIPAIVRYKDVGLFYTRTACDKPLWRPNSKATSVPPEVDTGNPEEDSMVVLLEALYEASEVPRRLGRFAANLVAPVRDKLAERRWTMSTERTKQEIAAHYDLTQEVYTGEHGFLDDSVQYSSGLLPPSGEFESLEDLQIRKIESLGCKLDLGNANTLLEVGGGWGGLAVEFAKMFPDLQIVSLTVSEEQFAYAQRRVEEAGVADRVRFVCCDYRNLEVGKPFDRVVSVEMIEAVDPRDLPVYFDSLAKFVDPEKGVIALQSINIKPEHYAQHRHNKSFANTAIFPGGALLPKETIVENMASRGWNLHEATDLTPSYALTLREWLRNFCEHEQALAEKWQSEGISADKIRRFQNGFKFYLAACQAGFRPVTNNIQCWQTAFCPN
jgi:cyclopropane fatty-acyl-phospholipid synthase-like methyltransferase